MSTGNKTYFFGVINPSNLGHHLYRPGGVGVWSPTEQRAIPFTVSTLDGQLLQQPEAQGRLHLAVINGWTILGMWDRTGDKRGASNASFIAEGVHSMEEMKLIAAKNFNEQWRRIQCMEDCREEAIR